MDSWNAGPHLFELELPDIFHCHIRGPVEAREAEATLRIILDELAEKRGLRVYVIAYVDSPDATFTPGARRVLSQRKVDVKGTAVVGGSALFRTAINLFARSMNVLWHHQMPIKLVKSPEEARAFIAELRAKEAAKS